MALPTVYEFKYKPEREDKKTFLLGTSIGGSLNFYLYNNFSDDSVDLSFKCQNYTLETATSLSTMALRASGTMELISSNTMELTSSSIMALTSSSTMTLSAEKIQASTNKTGTQFSFTSTASASEYAWIGAAEFGKFQDACVNLGTVYNTKTERYEPWISGYNSSGSMSHLYIVPGASSYVYLGRPLSNKGPVARVGSDKLQINIGTREKPDWKEVAVTNDTPTPSYKYHLTTLWIDVRYAYKLQSTSGETVAIPCGYSKIMIMPAHAYLDFEPNSGGVGSLKKIITNNHLQYGSLCYLVEGSTHTMGVITAHSNGEKVSAKHSSYGSIEGVSFTITTAAGSSVSILAQDIKDRKYQKIRVN